MSSSPQQVMDIQRDAEQRAQRLRRRVIDLWDERDDPYVLSEIQAALSALSCQPTDVDIDPGATLLGGDLA